MRRICPICAKVVEIVDRAAGHVGLATMVDLFKAEGLSREQVDCVLDAKVGSAPTLRDRLTSETANALMRGLGMPGRQSPEDVKKIRESMESGAGEKTWNAGEKPPDIG